MFQGFLAKAAKLCDTSGARKYESKVAVSFQRLQWHFQVLDVEDKRVQCAFTDKQQGGDKMKAMMASMVLLALYDAGCSSEQLKSVKAAGVLV